MTRAIQRRLSSLQPDPLVPKLQLPPLIPKLELPSLVPKLQLGNISRGRSALLDGNLPQRNELRQYDYSQRTVERGARSQAGAWERGIQTVLANVCIVFSAARFCSTGCVIARQSAVC